MYCNLNAPCPAGYTGPDGSCVKECGPGLKRSGTTCENCGADTYKAGTDTATSCTGCPDNSNSVAGSDAATDCMANAGFTGPDGGTPTACEAGTFKADTGNAGCLRCALFLSLCALNSVCHHYYYYYYYVYYDH